MSPSLKEKKIAEESEKTKKAREKIRKQLEETEKKITKEALKEKSLEIHRWIARHAHHRVILKNKNISLFDENQNTAKVSRFVSGALNKLQWNEKTLSEIGKKKTLFSIEKNELSTFQEKIST